jgi:hypothetical protein
MTANVAQAILTDDDWAATLHAVHAALRPGGHLVFETRDPARRAWEEWTQERTRSTTDVSGIGPVTDWVQVTAVDGDLVTFESPNHFPDGTVVTARSTLRFRSGDEVERSLAAAGFIVRDVRDAPDRPGRELVFLAGRAGVGD